MDGSLFDGTGSIAEHILKPVLGLDGMGWPRGEIGPKPEIMWVPLGALVVDERYQRAIAARGIKLIRSMVMGWDWALCGLLVVVQLDDQRFEVLDGQHRAVGALSHGGIPALPAIVVNCPSVQDRARVFVSLNSARVGTTGAQKFRAAIASGDREAVAIQRVANRQGVRILSTPPYKSAFEVGDTLATSSLTRVYRLWGEDVLRRVLAFCVRARLAPIRSEHLIGLGTLFGEEPWRGAPIDVQALLEAVEKWDRVADDAEVARLEASTSKAVAIATELYRRCQRKGE